MLVLTSCGHESWGTYIFIVACDYISSNYKMFVFLLQSGHDWTMLSSYYVKTDGDVAGWRELFSRLGVRDGLVIRKERVTLTAKELVRTPHMLFQLFADIRYYQYCVTFTM